MTFWVFLSKWTRRWEKLSHKWRTRCTSNLQLQCQLFARKFISRSGVMISPKTKSNHELKQTFGCLDDQPGNCIHVDSCLLAEDLTFASRNKWKKTGQKSVAIFSMALFAFSCSIGLVLAHRCVLYCVYVLLNTGFQTSLDGQFLAIKPHSPCANLQNTSQQCVKMIQLLSWWGSHLLTSVDQKLFWRGTFRWCCPLAD